MGRVPVRNNPWCPERPNWSPRGPEWCDISKPAAEEIRGRVPSFLGRRTRVLHQGPETRTQSANIPAGFNLDGAEPLLCEESLRFGDPLGASAGDATLAEPGTFAIRQKRKVCECSARSHDGSPHGEARGTGRTPVSHVRRAV